MRIVKFYCDHCGKEIKMEDDLNAIEILFDPAYKSTSAHLCNDCAEDLKKFISNINIKEVKNEEKEG